MKIPSDGLISLFERMYEGHWDYVWGDAKEGSVDCSGAFVYAYKQYGKTISHGSNSIVRKYISGAMLPISDARPGMAAFKVKVPGERGYDLPDKYANGTDPNDYYHIGLVDTDGKHVLNAKGTQYGFCRDELTRQAGWDCVAYLKDVEYEGGVVPVGTMAKVALPSGASGSTVNMRRDASRNAEIVTKIPVGAEIRVVDDAGEWCKVGYGDKLGWMMSNYIEYPDQGGESESLTDADREKIEEALKAMEQALETISSVIGRG